ncbi:hypothetical protein [Vibrio coralliilyticus]|uniref:hypothetical protein n=1 Tax=Vibrio coralliilyticus TaxID=190893 RepID=UPI002FD18358
MFPITSNPSIEQTKTQPTPPCTSYVLPVASVSNTERVPAMQSCSEQQKGPNSSDVSSTQALSRSKPSMVQSWQTSNTALTINGIALTPENIVAMREKWNQTLQLHKLDTSAWEDHHLRDFTHRQFTNMPSYDHTGQNTVIKSSDLFERFQADIQDQLADSGETDTLGTGRLFKFLNDADRTYAGLRLDKSGTTVKIVHYGTDEYPALRTEQEKQMEPAISGAFLKFTPEEKAEFFRMASFLKTVEKIGISPNTTEDMIRQKLQNYQNIGAHFDYSDAPDNVNTTIRNKETRLLREEKVLMTHKGISLSYNTGVIPKAVMDADTRFLTEKYNINNFDAIRESQSLAQQNRQEVSQFCEKLLNSEGRILMTGYAIAGFGDLVNFQMLYKTLIQKHPELKDRIDAYAHFYRYSIGNSTLNKLLDKDIKVVTHQNANRQWDPNYSYQLVSELAQRHQPEFEIQYNVGSVYHSVADEQHVLRVGEIGGMAGVSLVDDAYFTGLSRGAIGFGIPSTHEGTENPEIREALSGIITQILGKAPADDVPLTSLIQERFALMMARENSQVINQRRFYSYSDVHEGQNLSVGKRVLAEILKAMTEQSKSDCPIILATGQIEALREQAQEAGLTLSPPTSFNLNGSEYKKFHLTTESGQKAYIVQGFFNNALVNAVMKDASIPTVYSGEGSMNEGLSFGGKGFMIPFYDYQVTTLIESAGVASQYHIGSLPLEIDGNDTGFRDDPDKLVKVRPGNDALQKHCAPYDLVKLTLDRRPPQLYMVTQYSNSELHLKKLDKTNVDFRVLGPAAVLPNSPSASPHAQATIYKLEGWAQEWVKLIYDRNSKDLDLNKLGQQTPAMLKEERAQTANWFELFN